MAPQVRPVTWSERMPTRSAKSTSPPSAFARARITDQISFRQTRTASAFCSTARARDVVRHAVAYAPVLQGPVHPLLYALFSDACRPYAIGMTDKNRCAPNISSHGPCPIRD